MTILDALRDRELFGRLPAFQDLSTWRAWLVFLAAVYGHPFEALEAVGISKSDALALFRKHTGRTRYDPPAGGYCEAAAVVGRQAGKDRIAALDQGYAAITAKPEPDGTEKYSLSICQDARAALRTQLAYAQAPFRLVPILQQMVSARRTDALELTNGITLASYPCRPQAPRGLRCERVVLSELAFFRNSEGNPVDLEMLRAVRPTLATTGGKLLILSSPYAQTGALYELHRAHFGQDGSPVLMWQATAPEMNPTLPTDYLVRMEQDDSDAYRSEVLGEFRAGVRQLLDESTLQAAVDGGVVVRPPQPNVEYVGCLDVATGTQSTGDWWVAAVAHREGDLAVLDAILVVRPPFSTPAAAQQTGRLADAYRVREWLADRFAAGFSDAELARVNIRLTPARPKSELYLELAVLVASGSVRLLDHPELLKQLRGLERFRGATRDRVDHRRGSRDDVSNAAAGALVCASPSTPGVVVLTKVPGLGYVGPDYFRRLAPFSDLASPLYVADPVARAYFAEHPDEHPFYREHPDRLPADGVRGRFDEELARLLTVTR